MTYLPHRGGYIVCMFLLCACCVFPAFSFANVWDLEGVDIVPRSEWGATEGRGKLFEGSWTRYIENKNAYEARLAGEIEDTDGSFVIKKARKDLEQARFDFLEEQYPQDVRIIKKIDEIGGNELVWPREYAAHKAKIVIHHTAGDQVYNTPAIALVGMQDIYKYHTLTRGRGDVGYNFLIDPFGTIYEGRGGGAGVVGAHTDWNNISTIGIALMGNFDRDEPTPEARTSLKKISIALALKYDIDPFKKQNYFTTSTQDPFIQAHTDLSLVGHQDVKNTGCPGTHVYGRLAQLRTEVADTVRILQSVDTRTHVRYIEHDTAYYFPDTRGVVSIPFSVGGKVTCESLHDHMSITDCTWGRNNTLDIYLAHEDYPASGYQSLVVHIGKETYIITLLVVWEKELDILQQIRAATYQRKYPFTSPSNNKKVTRKIPVSDVASLMKKEVNVLLYDASISLLDWDISCDEGCEIDVGDEPLNDIKELRVIKFDGALRVFVGREIYDTDILEIKNNGLFTIENYKRTFANLPMHSFRGDLTIKQQSFKDLEKGMRKDYVLINSLSLDEYMAGVGEISERQHPEKITLMSLLTKVYALFYIDGSNKHPSIPKGVIYNAVDDPRIFQRYFGAGFEVYGKQWIKSLITTKNQVISYDGYLPILPYFHCSAGFTKSGREYFGWTDTPWLIAQLDIVLCAGGVFEGHGVGLSGDGAEAMAQAGMSYRDILHWYYHGIEILDI